LEVPKLVPILHYLACFQKGLFGGNFEQKHPHAFRGLNTEIEHAFARQFNVMKIRKVSCHITFSNASKESITSPHFTQFAENSNTLLNKQMHDCTARGEKFY
jgi:hypothetical protein